MELVNVGLPDGLDQLDLGANQFSRSQAAASSNVMGLAQKKLSNDAFLLHYVHTITNIL